MNELKDTNQTQCQSTGECAVVPTRESARRVRPVWKIDDKGATVSLRVALPGCQRENVDISSKDRFVTVTARRPELDQRAPESAETAVTYELKLRISQDLDPGAVEATLRDGILRLDFPRTEEAKPRSIPVSE